MMGMDLLGRIDRWGEIAPGRPAHRSGGRVLTYGELKARSNAVARYLAARLPGDRSPVAVLGHKEPEMLAAFLGAVKSGHPYIPLDVSLPPQRVERILAVAGVRVTLTPAEVARISVPAAEPATGPATGTVAGTLAAASVDAPTGASAPAPVGPDDPYYIIFTSGSTGEPKGVVITLGCLESFCRWMLDEQRPGGPPLDEQRPGGGEVFLNQAPFSFDLSVMDLYLSLATGGTLFSISKDDIEDPRRLFAALAASGVTIWVSTPSFVQMCLAEKTFAGPMLPHVRKFLFCGETLPPETAAALLDRFPRAEVWNTYGPTEATCATTSVRVDREILEKYSPLPVGRAKPDTIVAVLDEDGRPPAPGERGEIIIAGPNVSPGYLGRPDLTARAFLPWVPARPDLPLQPPAPAASVARGTGSGPGCALRAYRTGDWGRYQDGLLFFEGRMDSQVKMRGYRIELGDVEANLRALPGVRDAVVLPVAKGGRVESLAAFVVLASSGVPGGQDGQGDAAPAGFDEFTLGRRLRRLLGERLPAYMLPRRFLFRAALPMTPNGKADRRRLAAELEPGA